MKANTDVLYMGLFSVQCYFCYFRVRIKTQI